MISFILCVLSSLCGFGISIRCGWRNLLFLDDKAEERGGCGEVEEGRK